MNPNHRGVGVLSLQGDFAAHLAMLDELGVGAFEVRRPAQLDALGGLVIPGGESTTLLRFMAYEPAWWDALGAFHERGGAILGTCAGLILCACEVRAPRQRSLGVLDVDVDRNSYGRQIDSFVANGEWADGRAMEMVFIRAPRITRVGPRVEVLARHAGEAVAVREGAVIGCAFHPELARDPSLHRLLLDAVSAPEESAPGPGRSVQT